MSYPALDCIDRKILLDNLEYIRVNGKRLKLIEIYEIYEIEENSWLIKVSMKKTVIYRSSSATVFSILTTIIFVFYTKNLQIILFWEH